MPKQITQFQLSRGTVEYPYWVITEYHDERGFVHNALPCKSLAEAFDFITEQENGQWKKR